MNIKTPTQKTLDKYGLTAEEHESIWNRQGCVCAVCKKIPSTGNTHIDHDHCIGFKNMPPEEKKKHVRGITCWFCNRWVLARGLNLEKARNVVKYFEEYESRKSSE